MKNYNSRFNGVNGHMNQKQNNRSLNIPDTKGPDSSEQTNYSNNGDPWDKLAININKMNFETIKQNSRVCPKCHSKMQYMSLGEYQCPNCKYKFLDEYAKIRAFIDQHGPATALEIEAATGVSREIADNYLRTGKLEIVKGPEGYLRCEMCGADIRYGRICPKCARTDGAKMKGYYVEDVGDSPYGEKDAGEMRFLKKRNERIASSFKPMGRKY